MLLTIDFQRHIFIIYIYNLLYVVLCSSRTYKVNVAKLIMWFFLFIYFQDTVMIKNRYFLIVKIDHF